MIPKKTKGMMSSGIRLGRHELDMDANVRIYGGDHILSQATGNEWSNAAILIKWLATKLDEAWEDDSDDAMEEFCGLFGAFALTHRELLNRAAEVVTIEVD